MNELVNKNNQIAPPANGMVNVRKALRTRVIDFKFEFTRESCMEVVKVLNKIIELDKIMNTPDNEKIVRINIYSYGGQCDSLMALLDKIEWMKANGYTIITHNMSVAMSCGFVLSIAGNVKTCTPYATYLNHQISAGASGTFAWVETFVKEEMEVMQKFFTKYIAEHTHMTEEEVMKPYRTNRDVYYTACEAIKHGIADEIKSYEN